jgi:predicted TIM-barrel fold metal-dependent hydrolase
MRARMDELAIQYAVNLCSHRIFTEDLEPVLTEAQADFEASGRRIFYCGFFNPQRASEDLAVLDIAKTWPGFVGIKIHPSYNKISAADPAYEPIWQFAEDNSLPIVAHTWSVSSYNPVQALSTPDKFEDYARRYPGVRFVLGHSGGRGEGRLHAVRMCNDYSNVYMDFAGDVSCYRYFETTAMEVPVNKVLFGSDFPWVDHRTHLGRVYSADIPTDRKVKILRDNAFEVYNLENKLC